MNLASSVKYQFWRQKWGLFGYYGAFAALAVLMNVALFLFGVQEGGAAVVTNGITGCTAIFIFATGVACFKEYFRMSLQNGTSRKTLQLGFLGASALLCGVLAVLDEALTLLQQLFGLLPWSNMQSMSLLSVLYAGVDGWNPWLLALYSVLFSFFFLLPFATVGWFFGALYFRLNTPGKVIVSVALAVLPIVLSVSADAVADRPAFRTALTAVVRFLAFAFQDPWHCMASCFALFALFGGFSWLLVRRAYVK